MHTTHHHVPPSHSKPLAKLLTIAAVVLFAAGGYSSSVLSGLRQLQPVYVAQIPENFPASVAKVCDANCASEPDGTYKFCRNECVATGKSQPVGCDASGYKIGSPATDHECDNYATCEGSGFSCVASKAACTSAGGTENTTWKCADSAKTCCQPKTDDPAKRQVTCNDSCVSAANGDKNFCYRECHQNKVGYKHDVSCKNDGSGGVQWVLENEVADTDCGVAGGPTATPQPGGGPTATPRPGGGPTATPGSANSCTGDNFLCAANANECTQQIGGTTGTGKTCTGSQVCCNVTNVCAADGFQCAANSNECTQQLGGQTAAGKKCSGSQVCCNVKAVCVGTGLQCAANGNECTQQLNGAIESGKKCSGSQICCNTSAGSQPTSAPTPKPGTGETKNDCEELWTCVSQYNTTITNCDKNQQYSCQSVGGIPHKCCFIPNDKNVKRSECKDLEGPQYKGGTCYVCWGARHYVYGTGEWEWGYVAKDPKVCEETPECANRTENKNSDCILKAAANKCFYCYGQKKGNSSGYAYPNCPNDDGELRVGQCIPSQELIRKTIREASEGNPLGWAWEMWVEMFSSALTQPQN